MMMDHGIDHSKTFKVGNPARFGPTQLDQPAAAQSEDPTLEVTKKV